MKMNLKDKFAELREMVDLMEVNSVELFGQKWNPSDDSPLMAKILVSDGVDLEIYGPNGYRMHFFYDPKKK